MAINQKYEEYRVNSLPAEDLKAGDRYYLNVGNKQVMYIVSDSLELIRDNSSEFIEKDTMQEMRDLTPREVWALQNNIYKGVKLNGYYTKGDTPGPIEYYKSNLIGDDNGGNIIQIGVIKLVHEFIGDVDISYFGCRQLDLSYDNASQFQKACDLRKPVIVRNIDSTKYYFIDARISLYNSIKGIGLPMIKVNPDANTFIAPPPKDYPLNRYTAFTVTNKLDNNWLIIEGLDIDGWYDGVHKTGSEFEHNIHLSCANNIIIRDNILRNPCGDSIYLGKNTAGQGTPLRDNCSNVYIYNNRMYNQGRCGVGLISAYNTIIRDNYIEKLWSYVCPIDLEPNGESTDLLVQSTLIENNTIIGRQAKYAINVYGASDFSYNAARYPAGDYSTKDVIIRNNILIGKLEGVNITASWGKVVNVIVENNKIQAPQMVNVSGTFRTSNIVISGNVPYLIQDYINIGTFQYTDRITIKNNISKSNIGESILASRTKGLLIEGNNITAEGLIPGIRFGNDVSDIKIVGKNKIIANSYCIRFNNTSVIEGLEIHDNILRSETENIIFSDGVFIKNSKIGQNDWECATPLKYLTNSPAFFTESEGKFFDGKREYYVSNLPDVLTLTSQQHGYIYNKKISSLSSYNSSIPEADKYVYFNGSFIGIGFKGEWFGTGILPSLNTKIGHRYTNTEGGSGNTFYIREGGIFRAVQTISSGTTAQRPVNAVLGFRYFDTTLNRPVYFNGSIWTDGKIATASIDTAPAPSETYNQAEVQAILTELRDLKTKLRSAGILAT